MLETILRKSKYLTIVIVVITMGCTVFLYLLTSLSAITAIYDALVSGSYSAGSTKALAVQFLKIVDLFLICIGLQIIAAGIYKLFLNEKTRLPAPMNISSLTELKASLVKISTLVLLILFVECAVEYGPGRELLEYGIAIAAVLVAVSWTKQFEFGEGSPERDTKG